MAARPRVRPRDGTSVLPVRRSALRSFDLARREPGAHPTAHLRECIDIFGVDLRAEPAPIALGVFVAIERVLEPGEAREVRTVGHGLEHVHGHAPRIEVEREVGKYEPPQREHLAVRIAEAIG